MRLSKPAQQVYTVDLTQEEVEFIREITQNALSPDQNEEVRKSLFVGSSRILGYKMTDDGQVLGLRPDVSSKK